MNQQRVPFSEAEFHSRQAERLCSDRQMPPFAGPWALEFVAQLQRLLPDLMKGRTDLPTVVNCFAKTPRDETSRLFHAVLFACNTSVSIDEDAAMWATEFTVYASVRALNWEFWDRLPHWRGDGGSKHAAIDDVPTRSSLIAALGISQMTGAFLRLNAEAQPRGVVDLSAIVLGTEPVSVLLGALYDKLYQHEASRSNPDTPLQPGSPEVAKLRVDFDIKRSQSEFAAIYVLLPITDSQTRNEIAQKLGNALNVEVMRGDAVLNGDPVQVDSQFTVASLLETVERVFRSLPYFPPRDSAKARDLLPSTARPPAAPAAAVLASPSTSYTWDVFMSHAFEDKVGFVDGLVNCLEAAGLKVWYDKGNLTGGDSLVAGIEEGLRQSRFGVVVLSPRYFAKGWPKAELEALLARDNSDQSRRLLQVWLEISLAQVQEQSLMLASAIAFQADKGVLTVAEALRTVIKSRS
jgi:hypothetical protein